MVRISDNLRRISCLLWAAPLFAQPAFEVASVKPFTLTVATAVPPSCPGGRFVARFGLASIIDWAYGIQPFELEGLDKWPTARGAFAIEATSSAQVSQGPARPGPTSDIQCRAMVRTLLAERFKLTIHRESRTLSVYALQVAKNGAKMQPATDADQDGVHVNGAKTFGSPKGWSMPELADFLTRSFYLTPVVDRTGLKGLYKLTLNFAPGLYNVPGVAPQGDGPDIFSAVEAQLGLKLEQRKEPVETVVIDHIEQPEAN
jgi:uncharacterized protein (TIGR03435 family)